MFLSSSKMQLLKDLMRFLYNQYLYWRPTRVRIIFITILIPGDEKLECPIDNHVFNIKFLRPSKFYADSTFDRIKKYYKFKLKYKKVCDNLVPSSIKHVYEQEIISFLPQRDQDRRRILLVEVGSEFHWKLIINILREPYSSFLQRNGIPPSAQYTTYSGLCR